MHHFGHCGQANIDHRDPLINLVFLDQMALSPISHAMYFLMTSTSISPYEGEKNLYLRLFTEQHFQSILLSQKKISGSTCFTFLQSLSGFQILQSGTLYVYQPCSQKEDVFQGKEKLNTGLVLKPS